MQTVISIIDQFCQTRQNKDTEDRDHSKFRVSDAGKCHLMRYWKRQGKPGKQEFNDVILRSLHAGILFHNWIETILKDSGHLISAETEVQDADRIGHFDALVQLDDMTMLYDFKTINGKKWFYLSKSWIPDRAHTFQLVTYGSMIPQNFDEYRILYLNRDTLEIKEIDVDPYQHYQSVTEDWETLVDAWNHQQEPIPSPQSWECAYCQYKASCQHAIKR